MLKILTFARKYVVMEEILELMNVMMAICKMEMDAQVLAQQNQDTIATMEIQTMQTPVEKYVETALTFSSIPAMMEM